MDLKGKKILLGVTGGIAAYKSCALLRLLQKKGAEVRVAMTESATQFVAPLTFSALSKCPVYLKNGAIEARPFQHIDFPRWADLYLIVPCTANTLGKIAYGIADDPVSVCFMSCSCERIIAPAMNVAMYNSPAVKKNLEIIRGFEKTTILESPAGELACGEVGQGRLLEPEQIVDFLETNKIPEIAKEKSLLLETAQNSKKKVLITAGRTEESIDPVRYISNRSSGKTAVALAAVFLANDFDVSVIAGPMEASFPSGVKLTRVKSACEMHNAVMAQMHTFNAVVHCAAVADYRPKNIAPEKIKDSRSQLVIELVPNPNILRDCVNERKAGQVVVGFALETDHFEEHALAKFKKSGADAILLNAPVAEKSGFGFDEVRYALVTNDKNIPDLKMGSKIELAETIVDFISKRLSR